jgi:hypothetical protein
MTAPDRVFGPYAIHRLVGVNDERLDVALRLVKDNPPEVSTTDSHLLEVHMSSLRRKLEATGHA